VEDFDSYQFSEDNPRKRPGLVKIVLVAVASGFLGGLLSFAVFMSLYQNTASQQQVVINGPGATPLLTMSETTAFPAVEIAKSVGPAVVGIANFQLSRGYFGSRQLEEVSSGSGFIINAEQGLIVTNNHVIEGAAKLVVSLADGRNLEAVVVGRDARTDLAVIKVSADNLTAVRIGDSSQLQVGEPVLAIGNPGGQEFARSVTQGVISATNRFLMLEGEASFNLIQTDAAINPGNSGGPLVNFRGEVIGINSAKNQEPGFEGMGFAIPISDAMPIITQLIEKGYAVHPGLHITVDGRYTAEWAAQRGWPAGVYVSQVRPGGPAAKAGIRAGDVIVAINGVKIEYPLELTHQLFKYQVGDTVTVSVFRAGETFDTQVTLAELRD